MRKKPRGGVRFFLPLPLAGCVLLSLEKHLLTVFAAALTVKPCPKNTAVGSSPPPASRCPKAWKRQRGRRAATRRTCRITGRRGTGWLCFER